MIAIIIKKHYANRQTCGHLHTFLVMRTHLLIFTGTLVYIIYCILPCLSAQLTCLNLGTSEEHTRIQIYGYPTSKLRSLHNTSGQILTELVEHPILEGLYCRPWQYETDYPTRSLDKWPFSTSKHLYNTEVGLLPSHSQASEGLPTQMPGQI